MLLKRFEAATLPEALSEVEQQCGKDALLVETRQTSRGVVVVATRAEDFKPVAARPDRPERAKPTKWTRGFREIAANALAFGLSDKVLRAVEQALIGTRVHLDSPNDPAVPRVAAKVLRALIRTESMPNSHVTAFVGPTGVGKTTTLAKIAARAIQDADESVAIVTIDTYRIAAVEQLRALADMLGVPFEVAFTPEDLRRAVQRFQTCDRVLIDTTGRSPFDRSALATLGGTLGACKPHIALCIAASSRHADAVATCDGFRPVGCDSMILTKWDETRRPGEPLSLAIEQNIPLSWITLGQEVPDDIVEADAAAIAASALASDENDMEHLL